MKNNEKLVQKVRKILNTNKKCQDMMEILVNKAKAVGMTAEQFISAWFKSEILTPKRLTFKATNIYYEANKETIEKLEKEGMKPDENIKGNI